MYKLIFENQSTDIKARFTLERDTKMYLFLRQVGNPCHIFRVHKKTLNVKGIKEGKDGYRFDIPTAIWLDYVND